MIEKKQNISKYQLSELQVNSILELRLQKLTAFGINEIETEIKKLSDLIVYYNKILKSKKELFVLITKELEDIKSKFCLKNQVLSSFEDLIKNADFKHIIFSYSTEGIMSVNDIKNVLIKDGIEESFYLKEIPYRRYKHTKGPIKKDLCELLFYIRKRN